MNIKPGPLLNQYADTFGIDINEVCEWVSQYVSGPWTYEVEPTEKERLASIKAYIQSQVDQSLSTSISIEMASKRMKTLETGHKVTEAPF